jgi:hypothetical protein
MQSEIRANSSHQLSRFDPLCISISGNLLAYSHQIDGENAKQLRSQNISIAETDLA